MKRSEMLGRISDALLQFINVDKQYRDLIADTMLFECERAGMLPPNDFNMGVPKTYEAMLKYHSWEEITSDRDGRGE